MVLGKPFWECYWWAHDDFEVARLKESIQQACQGKAVRYDARVRMAGEVIIDIDFMLVPVIDDQGRITHLIPSGVDITERKSAEQAVRDSEAFTRSVLENMAQFAWMGDESGALFWYNQRWYDYTERRWSRCRGGVGRRYNIPTMSIKSPRNTNMPSSKASNGKTPFRCEAAMVNTAGSSPALCPYVTARDA